MRHEVEGETARLRYLSEAHQTVRGDIALTKRATEKTTTDVSKAQDEKLHQVCTRVIVYLSHVMHGTSMSWL